MLAAELVSGLTGQPARFALLARNVGPASTEIAYELAASGICFHREFSDEPDDEGQRSVRRRSLSELRGLPRGVAIESSCDHALYPTLTVVARGIAADAAARIVAGLQRVFSSVVVR